MAKQESKLKMRRRRRRIAIAFMVGVSVLCVLAGATFGLRSAAVRISDIQISGAQVLSASTVRDFVEEKLSGTYLWVLPKNSIFLYPRSRIARDLVSAYPVLRDASVHMTSFSSIAIELSERSPWAKWCGENVPKARALAATSTAASERCILMDENGLAYMTSPQFSDEAYVSYYGALPGSGILPAQFLTQQNVRSLAALVAALQEKALSGALRAVVVDDAGDVSVFFENGFSVRFALGDDAGAIVDRFAVALASAVFNARPTSDFEYIDLRFGDKAYYRALRK